MSSAARGGGAMTTPLGIWPWASDNTLFQFNEVSGVKGTKDGEAFDSDAYCKGSTYQYNYSHDNDGGFMLICCSDNTDTVVRYNISQNDRARLFRMAGRNENVKIYNNVFFVGKGTDVQRFLWMEEQASGSKAAQILNNIFYVAGIGRNVTGVRRKPIDDGTFFTKPGFGGSWNIVFERNVIFGNFQDIPDVWKKMTNDPKLVAPGTGANGRD